MPYVLILASYLLGAIPGSYLTARFVRGIDLRDHGSGNLGATNTFRVLGWRLAVPVLIFDVLKGFVPTAAFPMIDGTGELWFLAYGAAAIIGHMFPVYVGFRGGKGVATSAGVFLALSPLAVLATMVIWSAVVFTTRVVSKGSLVAAALFPLAVLIDRGPGPVLWLAGVFSVLVIIAHRANIGRLIRGIEPAFGREGGNAGV